MSSKNKTRKKKDTNPKNKTRKAWKSKHSTKMVFKINNVEILGKNGKKLRVERLKPGVTDYLPAYKEGDIRRVIPKNKQIWKKEDIVKYDYLMNKYDWSTN